MGLLLIETADNNNRTVANVEVISTNAMVPWEHRVLLNLCLTILVTLNSADGLDPEELELELIDFGAEEFLKMKTEY
jgi:hypothetical protein